MKTTSFSIRGKDFILYPEYAFQSADEAVAESKLYPNKIIITGIAEEKRVLNAFIENGEVLYAREKLIYTSSEKERGCVNNKLGASPITPFVYNQIPYSMPITILPILCYEICFPDSTMIDVTPDAVIHHVGFPMYDKHQYKAWLALQRSLGIFYNCPVYVSTGGEGELAIQGRIF